MAIVDLSDKVSQKTGNTELRNFRSDNSEPSSAGITDYMGKEFFDKFGFGLVSQQFLNVLFSQIGASYFLIGIFHGLRDLLSIFTSIFMQEYLRIRNPVKWRITFASVLLGIGYVLLAIGLFNSNILLVGFSMVGIGIITTYFGQIYSKYYVMDTRKYSKLRNLPSYGVFVLIISLVFGAFVLDRFPVYGNLIQFGVGLALPGYFLLISLAVICFIISMMFLRRIIWQQKFEIKASFWFVAKEHLQVVWRNAPVLFSNKIVMISLLAGTMTGIVQTLGNVYYGLFIYKAFKYVGFGGYMNIAMIFIIAIVSMLLSSIIARILSKKYGNLPVLTFGTVMVALQPLAYYFNPNLLSISMATVAGAIGASLVGLAIGLLVTHALSEDERSRYYTTFSFLITLPYLLFVPIGAWIAQALGFSLLFLIMGSILLVFVVPMYFLLQVSLGKRVA